MATTVTKEPLQPQQGPSSSSTAEDESLKRNTDCVYFLASPLTCKKGSECEYRHSEYARMNPRDCFYWMNGNCLNPKCGFRHPPLDGLVGPQAGNFEGPPAALVPPSPVAPQNLPKQGVPCIFFQKGLCLKGDRCPFMHGPNPPSNKSQQVPASTAAPEAPLKKSFASLEKCSQLKMNSHANTHKAVEAPPQANAIPKVQLARTTNGAPVGKGYPPHSGMSGAAPRYEETKPSYVDNGILRSRTSRAHHGVSSDDQNFQNGRDADDSLRESSPGFDVLVDDKLSEEDFYHNEDQYVRMRGHDGRNLKEFDMGHQDDYNLVADVDPVIYHSRRGYDSSDRLPDKYARDHRRASLERSQVDPAHHDRRGLYKSKSPDFAQNSDLRHRLSKPRRVNGLKSVVNADYSLNDHAEDRSYRSSRRDSRRSPIHESSRGHRLQGRIKLPRRSPPIIGNDMLSERESERGRSRGRLSPSRQIPGQQGRLRDRLSGRIQEESLEGRKMNDPVIRRDTAPSNGANFAGPKSLSELRGTKQTDNKQHLLKSQQSAAGGKLRETILASSVGTEGDVAFEGPKPLSEILKRKRTASTGVASSNNEEESKQNEKDVRSTSVPSNSNADIGKQVALSSTVEQTKSKEENKPLAVEVDEEEGEISNKKIKLNGEGESSLPNNNKDPEAEESVVAVVGEEHEFEEEYDQGDGEYEYEQDDREGYHLNEEFGDHEEEFMEEDDGDDDFAKKLGVSF